MLTMLQVQNVKGDILALPLADFSGGYVVKDIQGLSPVKASVTSTSLAQVDGAQPQSTRRDIRNITMKLGLKPNYAVTSVDSLRAQLYNWFLTGAFVTLKFYKDGLLFATATGTVESCDNSMFSSDPEVNISIICYDPDFYAPVPVIITGNTVANSTNLAIPYEGTSEAGVVFVLHVNRTISDFKIINNRPDNQIQVIEISGSIFSGADISVNTIPGQKSVISTVSSISSSLLFFLQPNAQWTSLEPGINQFRAFCPGAAIPWTLTYTAKYGAI